MLSRSAYNSIRNPVLRVLQKMIAYRLCQRTTGYDKIQRHELWLMSMFEGRNNVCYANVVWVIARWMKKKGKGTQEGSKIICGQFVTRIARRMKLLNDDTLSSYSTPTPCKKLNDTTLREFIGSDGKLVVEDPAPGVARLVPPKRHRPNVMEIYQKLGEVERRKAALEELGRWNEYHWKRFTPLFDGLEAQ